MQPWQQAWQHALYGERGFYRDQAGPAGHFTTSSHGALGAELAATLAMLARRLGAAAIVDLGAGRGELLHHLARREAPDGGPGGGRAPLALHGVDVVDRPEGLPPVVGWHRSPGGPGLPALDPGVTADALVVANEWLDVVPLTVAEVAADGRLREVLVDGDGAERLGGPLGGPERDWARRWWPTRAPGERVEVGLARDEAWAGMLEAWRPLAALTVDYGHTREDRPAAGTLTGYRAGQQVPPVPDGSCDLTAHVAVDSLRHDEIVTQAEAVRRWAPAPDARALDRASARTDPLAHLAALSARGARHALVTPPLGSFRWVLWSSPRARPGSAAG